jgi:predicted phosphodiesterase
MRIAIISDMHGNCLALDTVLADLHQDSVDRIVCLGDAIQGGPQPAETVARLRELACPVVMGNADDWLLTGQDPTMREEVSERQRRVREWALAQLSADDQAFIAGFQPTVEIPLGPDADRTLICVHGSPRSYNDVILPDTPEAEFAQMLGPFQPAILTGGHTHMQQVRRLGDTFFFNPGSAGLAYNRHQPEEDFKADSWADYAVLGVDLGRIRLEFRRVPFDPAEMVRIILASGVPYAEDQAARYQPRDPTGP